MAFVVDFVVIWSFSVVWAALDEASRPVRIGGIPVESIHPSHICHIGPADQGHSVKPTRPRAGSRRDVSKMTKGNSLPWKESTVSSSRILEWFGIARSTWAWR